MSANGPVLVIGATGLLGEALTAALAARRRVAQAPPRTKLDLTSAHEIEEWLERERPVAVINAAAYTDVAKAERAENREIAYRVNRDGPALLARACHRKGLPLVHVSTDFVFDGRLRRPYREDDLPAPVQVYGRSKLEGERAVLAAHPGALIARTSTLFGPGRRARPNYVDAILAQAESGGPLRVVRLPESSPTYAPDLADCLIRLLERRATGLVHTVNRGGCTRLDLAREIVRLARFAAVIVEERPEPLGELRRPAYSVLDCSRAVRWGGQEIRSWREALVEHVRR